ncbi:MAG TPA: alpha-2-macroglobulin family protein [Chthoniobacterales bacterium]|nr:alpha-2-macroglobulin family protein [Chthoniobacterales bacterium]
MTRSFWLALGFLLVTSAFAEDRAVQLLLPSRRLDSTSTFELRFASEMVPADQIGKPATVSPLVLAPSVEGQFVWLSTRSGTFTPRGTLPLGTKYQISLRPGLKDAAGREVKSSLRETVETPPLRVKGLSTLGPSDPEDAPANPRFLLLFNANVDAAACAKFIHFVNGAGTKIEARVQGDDPKDRDRLFYPYQSDDRSLAAWGEKPEAAEPEGEFSERDSDKPHTLRKNILLISAPKPLPPGNGWKLVIDAGLPAMQWKTALPVKKEIEIGRVKPFVIASIAAESNRIAGRRIIIEFSKLLAADVTEETVLRWISVSPAPEKLKAEVDGRYVTLKGNFALGPKYRVTTKPGLMAREPFKLERGQTNDLTFKQVAPRLYFEDFSTSQHRAGTRRFRLLSINVPRVKVTARLFTGDNMTVALKAYDKYEEFTEGRPADEMYSRVDVEKLPGQVIWERELNTAAAVDKQEIVPLSWDEILGENKTGAVLLTAESIDAVAASRERVGTQAVIQLTDIGSVWKNDFKQLTLHLFSLTTGVSLPNVQLRLIDTELKQIGEAVTDAQGGARLPYSSDARWVFAQREGDSYLIAINAGDASVPLYRLGVTDDYGDEPELSSIFLFTERGVYKPGDVVHLKGIARNLNENQSTLPAGQTLVVKMEDAKDREVFKEKVTLSEFGSFAQEIKIPVGSLGKYRVSVADEEKTHRFSGNCDFQVQEYRPNAFEILIPAPPSATGPLALDLPITAKYFMGKPLSKAKLTWSLVARDEAFRPEGLSDFAFGNGIDDFQLNKALDRISQFNDQGTADLAADGTVKITAQLPMNPNAPQPRAAKLICEVTDISQQTVSESRSFVQHSSDYYFGLRRLDPMYKEGNKVPVELIAVAPDGKPLPAPVKSTVRLTRITWQTNRLAGAGDTTEFESKAERHVEWERELTTTPGAGSDRKPKVATLADVLAGKPGQYLLEVAGKDAQGRDILTSTTFQVAGPAETVWNYRNPYAVDLVTDKESYEPGQTATILVKTPIAGAALVTIERDKVLRSFVTQLTGNAPSVQVPLTDADAPNVFVSVMLLRGANDSPKKIKMPEYRIGYCEVKVVRPKDKLAVTVKSSGATAKPGEKIQLDADVRDATGKAAADSEVVLYAVDEGVLSLTGYKTPDPLSFFNQRRKLNVFTSLTLPTLLKEDVDDSDFANKGYLIGDAKGGPPAMDGLRKNFLALAFWNAALRTDAQGHVHAEFNAPDSLTRYRIIAVAASRQNQFGTAESAVEINKPLMIEASLPRFGNVGDKLTLRAVLHNNTDAAGEAEVELQLDPTAKAAETKRHLTVPARGSVPIDFPAEFVATGHAQWRWSARFNGGQSGELTDALQSELDVNYPAPLVREVQTKRIETNDSELGRVTDPQILEGVGKVDVNVANTRVTEIREALRQLLHYPYGCVEQTTSSLLPWLTVRDLRAAVPELNKSDAEVTEAVSRGIDKLFSMQTSSGGLSYWPGGNEASRWGSAYAGLALALAQRQRFEVPAGEMKKLLGYLSEQLRGTATDATGYRLSDRCLAVYALAIAGKPEAAYHDLLFQKRAQLSAEDRALVALAVLESKGPKNMVDELLKPAAATDGYLDEFFGSVARENALHLMAWTLHQPASPRVDELAVELFTRRSNGHWSTTQANAWSVLALSTYVRTIETGDRNASGEVRWNRAVVPFSVSNSKPLMTSSFPIDGGGSAEAIRISKTGGKVYTEMTAEARPKLVEQPRQNRGYTITRRYSKLDDEGKLGPAENLRVGDRVLVTLDIQVPRRATYLAVADPLPGVFEPINPVFKSQEVVAGETLGTEWVSDYNELRTDRALFFADVLYPGQYKLRYLARVISAGDALAPSAKIEEMYHPERMGTTETSRVHTESLK